MTASNHLIVTMSVAVLMMAWPASAGAQNLAEHLRGGQRVEITLTDGQTIKGKVRVLTPTAIEVRAGSEHRSIAPAEVARIRVHDPVGNGVNAGAKVGLVNALILFFPRDWCMALCDRPRQDGMKAKGLKLGLAMIAAGAAIGGVLDAVQMTTVYIRPNGRTTVSLSPLASASGAGVGIRLRW